MCATLGGKRGRSLSGRNIYGGANDLMKVTRMAQAMVTYFGMSGKLRTSITKRTLLITSLIDHTANKNCRVN